MFAIGTFAELTFAEIPGEAPEPVPAPFGWIPLWSEPVKQALRVTDFPFLGPVDPRPIIPVFGWFSNFSLPIQPRRVVWQQFYAGDTQTTAVPFDIFGWFPSWSDPVRQKPRLLAGLNQYQAFDPFPIINRGVMGWFSGFSEPKRFKRGLRAALQRTEALPDRILPNPVFVTMLVVEDPNDIFSGAIGLGGAASRANVSIEELSAGADAAMSVREP